MLRRLNALALFFCVLLTACSPGSSPASKSPIQPPRLAPAPLKEALAGGGGTRVGDARGDCVASADAAPGTYQAPQVMNMNRPVPPSLLPGQSTMAQVFPGVCRVAPGEVVEVQFLIWNLTAGQQEVSFEEGPPLVVNLVNGAGDVVYDSQKAGAIPPLQAGSFRLEPGQAVMGWLPVKAADQEGQNLAAGTYTLQAWTASPQWNRENRLEVTLVVGR